MHSMYLDKLIKAGVAFLIILSLFFLALTVNTIKENRFIGGAVPVSNTITVSGEGEVFAIPDIAEFSFSVVEEREAVDAAQKAATEKINEIISFLEDGDIEEKDIKTTSYNLYPRYEFRQEKVVCVAFPCPQPPSERVLVGYEIRQSIRVKVRDTDEAGAILAGVGQLGATDISGLSFTIDDEDELVREARKEAIDDARDKARELADDLGVDLVRVVSFSESGAPTPFYARDFGAPVAVFEESFAVAPEIPVGENSITANVSITYEIR